MEILFQFPVEIQWLVWDLFTKRELLQLGQEVVSLRNSIRKNLFEDVVLHLTRRSKYDIKKDDIWFQLRIKEDQPLSSRRLEFLYEDNKLYLLLDIDHFANFLKLSESFNKSLSIILNNFSFPNGSLDELMPFFQILNVNKSLRRIGLTLQTENSLKAFTSFDFLKKLSSLKSLVLRRPLKEEEFLSLKKSTTNLEDLTIFFSHNYSLDLINDFHSLKIITIHNYSSEYIGALSGLENVETITFLTPGSIKINDFKPFSNLKKLKKLKIHSKNAVNFIGFGEHLSRSLQILDLMGSSITNFQNLSKLENLKELTLDSLNTATGKSLSLGKISSLKKLNLGRCNEVKFQGVEELPNLEELFLAQILTDIIDWSKLRNLKKLTLFVLPESSLLIDENLKYLRNLIHLSLYHNNLSNIELKFLEDLTNLNELELYSCDLERIPKFENLNNLRTLNLSGNKLITKMENLENLKNLESLDITYCGIEKIENLNNLTKLTELMLTYNNITKIENLDYCRRLSALELDNNHIKRIENLNCLTSLAYLTLGHNPISKIENLNNLISLRILDLSFACVEKLENLNHLVNLVNLNLASNKIKKLASLDNLKNLKYFNAEKNGIVFKSEEVLNLKRKLYSFKAD